MIRNKIYDNQETFLLELHIVESYATYMLKSKAKASLVVSK